MFVIQWMTRRLAHDRALWQRVTAIKGFASGSEGMRWTRRKEKHAD